MDDITLNSDMFSSMEGELISNIKHPSFLSLSSEDSLDDKISTETTIMSPYFKTSTPFKRDIVDDAICEKSDDGLEDYPYNMTGDHFPSSRSGKRYSLSNFNEASRLYSSIINKSSSMQDVSSLASSFYPLRRDSCLFSTETLQSNSIATTKSKDSGFQRSTSCTSLTTNASKKYDHVQSKVKQYIQNIKQTEALRKMQKRLEKQAVYADTSGVTTANATSADSTAEVSQSPSPYCSPVSKRDLLQKVKALEEELKERDCVIEELEKNQSELRLKYAAAENQIDDLRIRASVHEDPLRNYMSDEKVAELLTNNVKLSTRKYMDNAISKQLMRSLKRTDVPPPARPTDSRASAAGRDLQPITKFGSSSVRMVDEYQVLKPKTDSSILKSSSCKCVKEGSYELTKSASNVDRTLVRFVERDMMELPYEKNSFAKVQNWQRSLGNLSGHRNDENEGGAARTGRVSRGPAGARCCAGVATDDSAEENRRKTRRYQKNSKGSEQRRYQQRRSYPAGCRCEKYRCRSKEDLSSGAAPLGPAPASSPPRLGKLVRSVSFASCEESLTSGMYDDGDSSSDSSAVFVANRHESYKEFKQRKLQRRFEKASGRGGRDRSPKWPAADLQKTKSANSVAAAHADWAAAAPTSQRSKRLLEMNSSYEYSCSSDRKQQLSPLKSHGHHHRHQCQHANKNKYRKLEDCTKGASGGCNALVKCRSSHACRTHGTGYEDPTCIQHSKSFDACTRGHDKESGHRLNKADCSCLTALENLKLKEHNAFAKFAEHMRKYPPKVNEKEAPIAYKRYSLQK